MFRNDVLEEAVRWHGMGVVPIPLVYRDKRAAIPWRHLTDVHPPLDMVKYWFTRPRNLGVLMGGGLTVVDFDNPLAYLRWRKRCDCDSYTVRTRRGYHVYLWLDKPLGATVKIEDGEIKGNGYVVAPPSFHPSGVQYHTVCRSAIARIANLDEVGLHCQPPTIEEFDAPVPGSWDDDDTSVVRLIRSSISIVSFLDRLTQVTRRGDAWICRCPFHDDRHPSMLILPREGRCFCFSPGCVAHRPLDVIGVCAHWMHLSNGEAIRFLSTEV